VTLRKNICVVRQCLEFAMTFTQALLGCCSKRDSPDVGTLAVRQTCTPSGFKSFVYIVYRYYLVTKVPVTRLLNLNKPKQQNFLFPISQVFSGVVLTVYKDVVNNLRTLQYLRRRSSTLTL
jgi:hypothetical protein